MSFRNIFSNWLKSALQYKRRDVQCDTLPIRVWIEPTNVCNLKCVMCFQPHMKEKNKGFMDFELFKKTVDEAREFAGSANLFFGGESLLHPKIVDMVRYCTKKGIRPRLETNGTLLTKKLSMGLIGAGLEFISFSFDGYDKKTYEKIRVGANFEKTLNNIAYFANLKKKMGKKKPYILVSIIQLPDVKSTDKKTKKRFLSRLKNLPINYIRTVGPHRMGGKIDEEITGSPYAFVRKGVDLKYQACSFPWTCLVILWDGRVVPCCADVYGEYVMGNIQKESLKEIWNNKKIKHLRTKLSNGEFKDIKVCKNCDFLWQDTFMGISKHNFTDFKLFIKENLKL